MGDNARIASDTYEAWNERDFDRFAEGMAEAEMIDTGSGERWEGREGAITFAQMWANAFPDGRIEIDNVVDAGDSVAIEFTGRGTQTGTLVSAAGEIPATGRSVELKLCDVWTFENGKAKTVRMYLDTGSMMTQLGLMPEPAGATASA